MVVVSLALMHYLHFKSIQDKMRALSRLLCTILIFALSLGSIIQYLA
jgi:hypothetical protein